MLRSLRALVVGSLALLVVVVVSAPAFGSVGVARGVQQGSKPEVLASLTVSSSKVEVRKSGSEKFKVAKDGAKLREGDTIRTDATGTAEVDYGNDSYTRLDVNTTFTIKRLTEEQGSRQVQGSLETGQAWNRTAAITESGSFEQEGAGANATVLGTAFAVQCDAVDHCTFTAVVHDIQLTGKDGVVKLLTPLDQCESSDTTAGGEVRDLTGVLCGDVTKISPADLPQWIYDNLVKDRDVRGIDDSGLLDGTFVVEGGAVFFVPASPATVPGPVRNVVAVVGNESATVSFDPPLSDGGSPILFYTATATPVGGSSFSVASAPVSQSGPGSPVVVDHLENGVTYTFSVTATNAIGSSPTSTPSPPVTPATVPGAPTEVSATAGNGEAEVGWSAPDDGGSPITGYTVTSSPDDGSCTASGSETSCTVTGLTNGTEYEFTVVATNDVGDGPTSNPSNAVTPTAPPEFGASGAISMCVSYLSSCTPSSASSSISVEDEYVAYFKANVTDPQSLAILLRFSTLPTKGTICAKTTGATGTCSGGYAFAGVANAVAVTSTTATYAPDTVFAYSQAADANDFSPSVTDSFAIEAANSAGKTASATVPVTVYEDDS